MFVILVIGIICQSQSANYFVWVRSLANTSYKFSGSEFLKVEVLLEDGSERLMAVFHLNHFYSLLKYMWMAGTPPETNYKITDGLTPNSIRKVKISMYVGVGSSYTVKIYYLNTKLIYFNAKIYPMQVKIRICTISQPVFIGLPKGMCPLYEIMAPYITTTGVQKHTAIGYFIFRITYLKEVHKEQTINVFADFLTISIEMILPRDLMEFPSCIITIPLLQTLRAYMFVELNWQPVDEKLDGVTLMVTDSIQVSHLKVIPAEAMHKAVTSSSESVSVSTKLTFFYFKKRLTMISARSLQFCIRSMGGMHGCTLGQYNTGIFPLKWNGICYQTEVLNISEKIEIDAVLIFWNVLAYDSKTRARYTRHHMEAVTINPSKMEPYYSSCTTSQCFYVIPWLKKVVDVGTVTVWLDCSEYLISGLQFCLYSKKFDDQCYFTEKNFENTKKFAIKGHPYEKPVLFKLFFNRFLIILSVKNQPFGRSPSLFGSFEANARVDTSKCGSKVVRIWAKLLNETDPSSNTSWPTSSSRRRHHFEEESTGGKNQTEPENLRYYLHFILVLSGIPTALIIFSLIYRCINNYFVIKLGKSSLRH